MTAPTPKFSHPFPSYLGLLLQMKSTAIASIVVLLVCAACALQVHEVKLRFYDQLIVSGDYTPLAGYNNGTYYQPGMLLEGTSSGGFNAALTYYVPGLDASTPYQLQFDAAIALCANRTVGIYFNSAPVFTYSASNVSPYFDTVITTDLNYSPAYKWNVTSASSGPDAVTIVDASPFGCGRRTSFYSVFLIKQ